MTSEYIIILFIGITICICGIVNITGNISTLHKYHRHRVTEENRKPFGRLVGSGTLTVGTSIVSYGVLTWIGDSVNNSVLPTIGAVAVIVCSVAGLVITLYGMFKYNKGIF